MLTNLALALPLLLADPAARADTPALLRAVPADAVVVVSVGDLDALRASMAENAWVAMLKDAELEPLRDLWKQVLDEAPQGPGEHPFDPMRVLATIHGPLAGFVSVAPGGAASGGLLIEPGEDHQAFDGLFNTIAGLLGMQSEAERELHGDTTLIVYAKPAGEDPIPLDDGDPLETEDGEEVSLEDWEPDDLVGADAEPDHAVLFQAGGMSAVVFGRDREPTLALARGVVDRYSASGTAAAPASGLLAEARKAIGGERSIEAVVDLQKLLAVLMEQEPPDEDDRVVIEKLGLLQTRWAYMGAGLGKGEAFDLDFALRLPPQGFLRQALGFLEPFPQRLARLAPQDAISVSLVGYDVWGLWQAAWKFAESIDAEATASGRAQLDMMGQSMGGIDIEADFLSQLTGEFMQLGLPVPVEEWRTMEGMWIDALGGDPGEGPQLGSVYVVGVKDPGIVQLFVEDLLAIAQMVPEIEELEGREVATVRFGDEAGISWIAGERSIAITPYPSAVRALAKQMANAEAPSVLQTELGGHLKAAQNASMVGVAATDESMRVALTALRAMAQASGEIPAHLLPDPSLVDRYLDGTLVSVGRLQGDTLLFQYRSR